MKEVSCIKFANLMKQLNTSLELSKSVIPSLCIAIKLLGDIVPLSSPKAN